MGKVFILLSLRDVPPPTRALGMRAFASSRCWTPFRPEQKVKLDKSEVRRGAVSCVMGFWGYDEGGHTSTTAHRSCDIFAAVRIEVCVGGHGAGVMNKRVQRRWE